ncbi:hypothetical protein G647_05048 [Cladophialophora carrionii CBS 160.54]|uniref:Uncharacterized protein n=1 Tax=Cladophialophora carrionii CBS 160.54 TaxID=1279043 RepID=V9D8J9_9EURO|nr:uncharacterized protein G647_05048 [Cladophialophora carrionii CBS 160.54]ETI23249.1 hypothetical protein G647_05048 [Cladophialophora carrionii CBS 160.54]
MGPLSSCLFCKTKPWNEKELELLNWYSVHMNGRLDTCICTWHNRKQIQLLPDVRQSIVQESRRRTTPLGELRMRVFMDHYRGMQADRKKSARCVVM